MKEKKLLFSQGYLIPKYKFRIPDQPYHFIVDNICNLVESKYIERLKGWSLYITIVFPYDLDENLNRGVLMGPSRNTYDKILSYGIHLPSSKIVASNYPFKDFCNYFFDVIVDFLHSKYGVNKEEVRLIEKQVLERFSPIGGLPITGASIEDGFNLI